MMKNVVKQFNNMDLNAGLVVPFYVDTKTDGTEGKVLDVEVK